MTSKPDTSPEAIAKAGRRLSRDMTGWTSIGDDAANREIIRNSELIDLMGNTIEALSAEIAAQKAMIARLVEALDVYSAPCDAPSDGIGNCGYEGNMCCRTARAALAAAREAGHATQT